MVKQEQDISKGIVLPEIKQNLSFTHPHIVVLFYFNCFYLYNELQVWSKTTNGHPLTFIK